MGFFANLAAKSEMKVRDQVLECFEELSSEIGMEIQCGNVLLPCHIISEVHNGFFLSHADLWVGIFRCQDHWWLYELDQEFISGLRSPNSEQWIERLKLVSPIDGGLMQGTIQSFAAATLLMIKEISESQGTTVPSNPSNPSKLSKEQVAKSLNEAIGILWGVGSKMKYVPLTDSAPDYFPENGLLYALQFDEFRPDNPLVLIADLDQDQWLLYDTLDEESGAVYAGPISKNSTLTALTILQLVTGLALTYAKSSNNQYKWMLHLDKNFVTPIFMGLLNDAIRSEKPKIKNHAEYVYRSILQGYQEFPVPNSAITKILDVMRQNNMTF